MTPETFNPSSIRFDFMKWVSLHHKDVPFSEQDDLIEGYFFEIEDMDNTDWWD